MSDPFSALLAAIPGLAKAGADIASASDEAKRNAQLIEFQKALINANALIASVQQQNASLLREKDDLEKRIIQLENWKTERDRYSMVTVFEAATVYSLKESVSNGEPPHYICPVCFQRGHKTLLQPKKASTGFVHFYCPDQSCEFDIPTGYRSIGSASYA
jgi:hypothetical protein